MYDINVNKLLSMSKYMTIINSGDIVPQYKYIGKSVGQAVVVGPLIMFIVLGRSGSMFYIMYRILKSQIMCPLAGPARE